MTEIITGFYDNRSDAQAAFEQLLSAGFARDQITLNTKDESSDYVRDEDATSYDHRRDEGGFWAMLKHFFFPDERRYLYSEGLSRGGTLLTVEAENHQIETARMIMQEYGSIDLPARAESWRQSGWPGYAAAAPDGAPLSSEHSAAAGGDIRENMEVITSDGVNIGTVDDLGDDQIRLAKNTSPDGVHHFVPLDWVDHVDAQVHLKRKAPEVQAVW
ncbi:DUF2171 domain-containing protein [Labrys sp. LIt4]|nr:DUF2171 domain-containing protein [Labrys sp. LIt4]